MKFLWILSVIQPVFSYFVGSATSSYQIEGWNKGKSIWDTYTENHNLQPVGNATNHYKLYKEDIKLMSELGIKHYRFSISWTRIMPFYFGQTDSDGLNFYHNIIDECLKYNITPYVTLYHWDLPQYLDTDINGWLDETIISRFLEYSKIMFLEYGHKVKHWMTINEPLTTSNQGYGQTCNFAPGKCSEENRFISARNQLLAHAFVGDYYLKNYDGEIGIVLNSNWIQPIDVSSNGFANNQMDDMLGLFLHPLIYGTFPDSLNSKVQRFNQAEQNILKNSFNFIAINHYTTYYINAQGMNSVDPEWESAQSSWLFDAPNGLSKLLKYIDENYNDNNYPLYITECGFSQKNDGILDIQRVHYLSGYLREFDKCYQSGMKNLKGFFVWSLLDNFEWSSGYKETFGIVNVDRKNNYKRTPKLSAKFIKEFIKTL
jgi:beta-glucosidase/6-phospho-beta-glucosidase/beta-galactosidase